MTVELICPSALRQLDDHELEGSLTRLSDGERFSGAAIIAHLIVMDERQTFVPMGYATLWKYCTEKLGYKEATAQRRKVVVFAARRYPEILARLADGRIDLSSAAMLAPLLTDANAASLLARVVGMSTRDVEALVADLRYEQVQPTLTFSAGSPATQSQEISSPGVPSAAQRPTVKPLARRKRTFAKPLGGGEQRLHVSVSKGTTELRDRLRELLPGTDDDELLAKAYGALLDKIDPLRRAARRQARKAAPAKAKASTTTASQPATKTAPRRPSRALSDELCMEADGRCTYVSPEGTRCTSRSFLQDEHHRPFSLGGTSTIDNLSKFCSSHNLMRARVTFKDLVPRRKGA